MGFNSPFKELIGIK